MCTVALQASPDNDGIKQQLADVYEIMGRTQEAYDLVNESSCFLLNACPLSLTILALTNFLPICAVIESRSKPDTIRPDAEGSSSSSASRPPATTGSIFTEDLKSKTVKAQARAQRALTRDQLVEYEKSREQATVATFARLHASETSMLEGDRPAVQLWLADAGGLVEDFRVMRQLFQSDRVSLSFVLSPIDSTDTNIRS